MGYWGPQGPWRGVPLGYHYDPWDPLSVPQYNSLGYPKTRVVEVKNLIFRGNFGTLWVGLPPWNFFSFWLKGRVCLGLQYKKKINIGYCLNIGEIDIQSGPIWPVSGLLIKIFEIDIFLDWYP